ncbi:secreted RxLR effector protein 161-like [Arachis hypogaea]|uniref:secreted RxLR effector protein 161-like n=1 Tax=Arachis hypogaea TaxID=3818 RepID=UPI003B21E48E
MEPNLRRSNSDGELLKNPASYRRLIGRLMCLTISGLDITYAVSSLSQFLSQSRTAHLYALHHLLRYIRGTVGQDLLFSTNSEKRLMAYVDADLAGCPNTRRSITRFCVFIGDSLVAWRSKKQTTVSRSFAESEYRAMAAATAELTWLKGLLFDFQIDVPFSMLFCDSQSTIHIASNPTFHERTKHIEVDCHFVREKVDAEFIKLIHVRTQHQLADVFTKLVTQLNSTISFPNLA